MIKLTKKSKPVVDYRENNRTVTVEFRNEFKASNILIKENKK